MGANVPSKHVYEFTHDNQMGGTNTIQIEPTFCKFKLSDNEKDYYTQNVYRGRFYTEDCLTLELQKERKTCSLCHDKEVGLMGFPGGHTDISNHAFSLNLVTRYGGINKIYFAGLQVSFAETDFLRYSGRVYNGNLYSEGYLHDARMKIKINSRYVCDQLHPDSYKGSPPVQKMNKTTVLTTCGIGMIVAFVAFYHNKSVSCK